MYDTSAPPQDTYTVGSIVSNLIFHIGNSAKSYTITSALITKADWDNPSDDSIKVSYAFESSGSYTLTT